MENILENAITLVKDIHNDELDRDGNPLIEHLLRVMSEGKNTNEMVAGLLHHCLETELIKPIDLLKSGYPSEVVNSLKILKRQDNETYGDYLDRISRNQLSAKIKCLDLSDKLDIRNLRYLSQNRYYELRFHLAAYRHLLRLPIGSTDRDRLYSRE